VGLALAVSGCQSGKDHDPGTLTVAARADVAGIFPSPLAEAYTLNVNKNVFEGLVKFDRELQVVPALAQSWERPDDRTYVFELRRGLRFSDGHPVGTRDVVASLEAGMERGWPFRGYLGVIESVEAVGERRVQIRTSSPNLLLLRRLAAAFIVPADALRAAEAPVVGTGPYRLESWDPNQELVLVRNEHYWGGEPAYERVRLAVVPDTAERIAMVERGEAELADHVPPESVGRLWAMTDLDVIERTGRRVLFLCLQLDAAPFSDARVREAFDLALDRRELIARALSGRGEPASQIAPRTAFGHNPDLAVTGPDPTRARALLAEAGYAEGLDIRLDGPGNRYLNDQAVLRDVARQLAAIGVNVEVNVLDKRDWLDLILSGASTFHLLGWVCELGDAGTPLDSVLHSREASLGSFNTMALADTLLDGLVDTANRSPTFDERRLSLQRAMARVAELRPILPWWFSTRSWCGRVA